MVNQPQTATERQITRRHNVNHKLQQKDSWSTYCWPQTATENLQHFSMKHAYWCLAPSPQPFLGCRRAMLQKLEMAALRQTSSGSHRGLAVVLCLNDLLATHCADALLVCTAWKAKHKQQKPHFLGIRYLCDLLHAVKAAIPYWTHFGKLHIFIYETWSPNNIDTIIPLADLPSGKNVAVWKV